MYWFLQKKQKTWINLLTTDTCSVTVYVEKDVLWINKRRFNESWLIQPGASLSHFWSFHRKIKSFCILSSSYLVVHFCEVLGLVWSIQSCFGAAPSVLETSALELKCLNLEWVSNLRGEMAHGCSCMIAWSSSELKRHFLGCTFFNMFMNLLVLRYLFFKSPAAGSWQ